VLKPSQIYGKYKVLIRNVNQLKFNNLNKAKVKTMRKIEVSTEEIINAGHEIRRSGSSVTGYRLRSIIGKGRPERLLKIWEQEGDLVQEQGNDLIRNKNQLEFNNLNKS
jgi:hypothetical protein